MAYQKLRYRRKTASGFDIYHLETDSSVVLRFSDTGVENGTVEEALRALENADTSKMNTVPNATQGNFAQFGANGQLADSGFDSGSFAAANHSHTYDEVEGLTSNRVVVSNENGTLEPATITVDELAKLSGVSGNIQTQLNTLDGALDNYILTTQKGVANGVAPLNEEAMIDSQYLPSYVDDVVEGTLTNNTTFTSDGEAVTPETGKIYVDTGTNLTYRWSGSQYTEISKSLALGTSSNTAYRGDYGQIAYEHSQSAHARVDATNVVKSSTNGNILINSVDTNVYTHPTYAGQKSDNTGSVTTTFTAITSLTLLNGHVSGYTSTTYTIPAGASIIQSSTQPSGQNSGDIWLQPIS